MQLSEEVKNKIKEEAAKWCNNYASHDLKYRQKLGMFFTPANLTIQMIEKFDSLDDDIFDPCAGNGSLLAACIIAGADPKRVYANEIDKDVCELVLKPRLEALGVPSKNIHIGDALREEDLNVKKL